MISFADQAVLWLLLPLLLGMWSFSRIQRRSLAWLEQQVSPRFRQRFSVYTRTSLTRHLALLTVMGSLLVVAAAGPGRPGEAQATDTEGRVLLLVDASASMYAGDVETIFPDREEPTSRLEVARQIALELISNLSGYRFALASYSGSGVVHLPMTTNRALLEDALRVLETHNYYKNTGSSLAGGLDVVSHFTDPDGGRLQVVMLGDGELPQPEEFDESLAALPPQGIVVHSIAIGSSRGQNRLIYDFRDIIAKKEEPAVLREYRTKRVDKHLKRIARRTGGYFSVAEPGVTLSLSERIRAAAEAGRTVVHEQARKDLSPWLLAAVLAGFLFDTLLFGHRRRASSSFDLARLGNPSRNPPASGKRASTALILVTALLLSACADSPRKLAHRENERGIRQDAFRRHDAARPHYERSRGYRIESQIPIHNLARSVALAGDISEAHDLFQEALTLEPALAEALFNDGVTLYTWGEAERDPKNCDLERTRELWLQAAGRFAFTVGLPSTGKELRSKGRANHRFLAEALAAIEELIANPPEHCFSEAPQAAGGGGEEEQEAGGGGDEGEKEEEESEGGEDESEGSPPGEGESEDEQDEGEGESEDDEQQPQDENQDQEGEDGEGTEDQGPGGKGSGAGGGQLSEQQLSDIRELIQQIAERGREGERYHRRTGPEQFSKADWSDPDPYIWW